MYSSGQRTYIQRKTDPNNRQRYRRPASASLCFLTLGACLCSLLLHQSYSELHQTKCKRMLHNLSSFPYSFFFPLQANTSLSVLMLFSAYQPSTPCMLYFLFFFFLTSLSIAFPLSCGRRIALVPIILTTAKFERPQPKMVKLHQSSLVQSID